MSSPSDSPEPRAGDPAGAERSGQRVSPFELFYDLVFAGAILGLSIDFGRTETWSAIAVAGASLLLAWWIWQETMLLTNRIGDPLRPLSGEEDSRRSLLRLAIRWVCFAQMVAVILIALFEPVKLQAVNLEDGFVWASFAAVAALFLLRELGARLNPELRLDVVRRRPWELVALAFFLAAGLSTGVNERVLWLAGLFFLVVPGLVFIWRQRQDDSPIQRAHVSERLMLFILIISGDLFLKIIVYWNASLAKQLEPIQLIFVSSIIFSIFRLYVSLVGGRQIPKGPSSFTAWLLLHLVLSFALLVAAGGMVEYVTPKDVVENWNLMSAGFGIALTIVCIAALDWMAGRSAVRRRVISLLALAGAVVIATVLVAYLTPGTWRIGMATIAAILLVYLVRFTWTERGPAPATG